MTALRLAIRATPGPRLPERSDLQQIFTEDIPIAFGSCVRLNGRGRLAMRWLLDV